MSPHCDILRLKKFCRFVSKEGSKYIYRSLWPFFLNQNLSSFEKYSVVWDVVCDQIPKSWSLFKQMAAAKRLILTIPGLKCFAIWRDWALVPEEFYPLCEFYFPYRLGWRLKWSPRQIVAWLKRHPRIVPHFKPSQGLISLNQESIFLEISNLSMLRFGEIKSP